MSNSIIDYMTPNRTVEYSPVYATGTATAYTYIFHLSEAQHIQEYSREYSLWLTPNLIYLMDIDNDQYKLVQPIVLAVEILGDDTYLIRDRLQLSIYGIGDSRSEAIEDYSSMLIDFYIELVESNSKLSKHLLSQLAILEKHIAIR